MSTPESKYRITVHVDPKVDLKSLNNIPITKMLMKAEAGKVASFLREEGMIPRKERIAVKYDNTELISASEIEIQYPFIEFNGNCYIINLKRTS